MQQAGRFAPSPTGPLHFGSLLAALASYLDARASNARWFLRIDDLDTPRNAVGAEAAILTSLETHGLLWDGAVLRQSERLEFYHAALDRLAGECFYCSCSRAQLRGQPVYPGTCRGCTSPTPDAAIRISVESRNLSFVDGIAGRIEENLARTVGDFIVRRRDGVIAYQLATAVDDGQAEITRVVRGGDLLDNTIRQLYLMERLGLQPPSYAHLPVLTLEDGSKLSKQTYAPPLDDSKPSANLVAVMPYLGLNPPADASGWQPVELLDWGTSHWHLEAVSDGSHVFRH